VITWDDSEGYYDHVRPPLRVNLPGVGLVSEGPRVPMIVISPFAKTGIVSHEMGDQASAVKMVDAIFGLQPLAALPNERRARTLGFNEFGQLDLGPFDGLTQGVSDLVSAFDPDRLAGRRPPLSPGYASIPERLIKSLPAVSGYGCNTLGITPTDIAQGIQDNPPTDFNPRPGTDPPPNAPVQKVNTSRLDD
jgi:phospholipase C